MPERPENPTPPAEQRPNQERELSPEQIEKIMEKVQDIDKSGVAFSALRGGDGSVYISQLHTEVEKAERVQSMYLSGLKRVFNQGLIGAVPVHLRDKKWDSMPREEEYKIALKTRHPSTPLVHFNITGRMNDTRLIDYNRKKVAEKDYMEQRGEPREISASHYGGADIIILFDVSQLKETDVGKPRYKATKIPLGTYGASNEGDLDLDETGRPRPDGEYGFLLAGRVAPHKFTGVIINPTLYMGRDVIEIDKYSKKVTEIMLEARTSLIPIYDRYGNLVWPKQMSYDEVKQLVAEREAKKI